MTHRSSARDGYEVGGSFSPTCLDSAGCMDSPSAECGSISTGTTAATSRLYEVRMVACPRSAFRTTSAMANRNFASGRRLTTRKYYSMYKLYELDILYLSYIVYVL